MKIEHGFFQGWEIYLEDTQGNRLPEHKIVHVFPIPTFGGKITFFVECENEQEFAIVASRPPQSFHAIVDIEVDGRAISRLAFNHDDPLRAKHMQDMQNGVVVNRNLKFCKLELTEDGPELAPEAAKNMGVITLRLTRAKFRPSNFLSRPSLPSPTIGILNEKSKKGLQCHYIGGGTISQAWSPGVTYDSTPIPGPTYEVNITYRTRDLLMAQGIIPNPNPVTNLKAESTPNPGVIKDEKPVTTGNNPKKRAGLPIAQGTGKRTKKNSGTGRAIIDLTADSDDE